MVCNLPAPVWLNSYRSGLLSSTEDTTNSTYDLVWGQAQISEIASNPGLEVYYNIYWSQDILTLFDTPRAYSTVLTASIPKNILADNGDGYLFGVRAAQLGTTVDFSNSNLPVELDTDTWLYPAITTTRLFFDEDDGYLNVLSVDDFPEQDGYIKIGAEVIFYSNALDGYDGYGGFLIAQRDPYGCNDGYHYNIGTAVELFRGFEDSNGVAFLPTEICNPDRPYWAEESLPGLMSAGDLGIGQVVELHWGPASAPGGLPVLFNVYWAINLENLWDRPRGITDAQTVLVPSLSPGDGYYFGVRATYFPDELDISELEQLSGQLFGYPADMSLTATYSATGTAVMLITTTVGLPATGFIVIDSEIFQYIILTSTSLTIIRRDVFDFGVQEEHLSSTAVSLFKGVEEDNIQFYHNVASWDKGEVTPLMPVPAGGPEYMQAIDGYRTQASDNLTEDHSNFEDANQDFEAYPFCGYRATNFVELYTRGVCNTYFGGRQDGLGGVDINTVNLQRQEMLLGITGEPFTLLRKKFTGRYCPKLSHRHEHPHSRCGICFGTTFEGGYDRYINPRELRPGLDNPNGLIMARVTPYKNDLDRSPERGLTQIDEVPAWTLSIPTLKDSDILVRYIFDSSTLDIIEEEFRYQVLHVTRNRIIVGNEGQQQFALRKIDKTDAIYLFAVPVI